MHRVLAKYGGIVDVYIPAKKAANGRRFGFVRFKSISDISSLLSSLNSVMVDDGTLFANRAKHRTKHRSATFQASKVFHPAPAPASQTNTYVNAVKATAVAPTNSFPKV
ncbi:hypothetical protein Tsubulata_040701 [Turnera subulata]|uniref:RRM domain-containing protein n=1 Tax=Turnera subulata TaxID=218843 RepID=A0A9Q0FBB6_9ROSI|nr:hypothetical protein Tsubulata_040701 [Turnera subulata]